MLAFNRMELTILIFLFQQIVNWNLGFQPIMTRERKWDLKTIKYYYYIVIKQPLFFICLFMLNRYRLRSLKQGNYYKSIL